MEIPFWRYYSSSFCWLPCRFLRTCCLLVWTSRMISVGICDQTDSIWNFQSSQLATFGNRRTWDMQGPEGHSNLAWLGLTSACLGKPPVSGLTLLSLLQNAALSSIKKFSCVPNRWRWEHPGVDQVGNLICRILGQKKKQVFGSRRKLPIRETSSFFRA